MMMMMMMMMISIIISVSLLLLLDHRLSIPIDSDASSLLVTIKFLLSANVDVTDIHR